MSYPGGERLITPSIEYPVGTEALVVDPQGRAIQRIAVGDSESRLSLVGATEDGRVLLSRYDKQVSFFRKLW